MATATAPPPPPPTTTTAPANNTSNNINTETRLQCLARQTSPCLLSPKAFFVSWQGVLTLAYSGFPPQLAALKAALADAHGDGALPKESPGSRWPKTTLGCVRDGRRLSPEQLRALLDVCREASADLDLALGQAEEGAEVEVRDLSVLTYECRSLERVIARERLALLGGGGGGAKVDTSPPSAEEAARVASVLAESDDPDYWYHASRDGGREGHYRSAAPGVTLVHELGLGADGGAGGAGGAGAGAGTRLRRLLAAVRRFRERVDAALPGVFAWFGEGSLHVTVRAIIV